MFDNNTSQIFNENFIDSEENNSFKQSSQNINVDDLIILEEINQKEILYPTYQWNNSSVSDNFSNTKIRNDLIGTPSDVALLRYVESIASVEGIRQRYKVYFLFFILFKKIFKTMFEIPFNSVRRWQLVVAKSLCTTQSLPNSNASSTLSVNNSSGNLFKDQQKQLQDENQQTEYIVMMKGAAEVILSRCNKVAIHDKIVDINDEFRAECQVN